MLASNFHRFSGPFRLPNALALGACSIPFNIEREKWDFIKICIFPWGKSLFLRFRALKRSADSMNNWWDDALKIHWKSLCFLPSILSKIKQNSTKIKISKSISPKHPKSQFFDHLGLPKPFQNRQKIYEKLIWKTKAKKWGKMSAKSAQNPPKSLYAPPPKNLHSLGFRAAVEGGL